MRALYIRRGEPQGDRAFETEFRPQGCKALQGPGSLWTFSSFRVRGCITLAYLQVEDLEALFVRPLLEFYQSSGISAVSNKWNYLRQGILREAVKKLVPQLQEETGGRLLSDAKEIVVEAYGDQLWKYSSLPPVQVEFSS